MCTDDRGADLYRLTSLSASVYYVTEDRFLLLMTPGTSESLILFLPTDTFGIESRITLLRATCTLF